MKRPKLCGNCAFPQNFYTIKLGEITVFYPMKLFRKVSQSSPENTGAGVPSRLETLLKRVTKGAFL